MPRNFGLPRDDKPRAPDAYESWAGYGNEFGPRHSVWPMYAVGCGLAILLVLGALFLKV